MSGGRPVVGAAVSRAGRAVSGEGEAPLSAESCHPAREVLDAPQKLVVVC
jgi:hypothetical protein